MRIRLGLLLWPVIVIATLVMATFPQLGSGLHADNNLTRERQRTISPLPEGRFSAHAGIDGEIFPAFANYASLQSNVASPFASLSVSVTNPAKIPLFTRVSVEIPGWSEREIQNVTTAPGETKTTFFSPAFRARFYENHEIQAATAVIHAYDRTGQLLHSETIPVRLRSAEDMYWGNKFKYASFIASWVTPHDPEVEEILARAKEFMPGRRLPGYEEWKSPQQQKASTYAQAQAIYRALQRSGLSYVKSSLTFGRNTDISERVRMPGDAIQRQSANCIDGVVTYASLFENLGMDAEVVLVPGHAYVAVREAQDSNNFLYIETALTGRTSFEKSVLAATGGIAKYDGKNIIRINIAQSREAGIFPMPVSSREYPRPQVKEASLATNRARR